MSGFSAEWLALREPADHRARNREVAAALAARLAQRERVEVVDLGCGSGSNLRAMAELLPARQSWTLVDLDEGLLAAARAALSGWSDTARELPGGNVALTKSGREIDVTFRRADLAADVEAAIGEAPSLVTAAALFDLAAPAFIARTARAVTSRDALFYTVLTYNGIQHWGPRHPSDNRVTSAFNRHQMSDKGLGASAGPTAPVCLADAFRAAGYGVIEGDSPWRLAAPRDATLIAELVSGQAAAALETGTVDRRDVERWSAVTRTSAEVGHTDTFAFPQS
ncbi:MAG: class I SAM-dependent methyltransferase [Hyphomicrobiaceae bacterium]